MSIRIPIFIINKSISLLSSLHLPQVVVLDRLQDQVGHGVVAHGLILVLVLHLRRVDQDLQLNTTTSNLKRNLHKLGEALLHPVFVPGGVVTQDQVEAGFEVALVLEEVYWAVVLAEEKALFW